MLVTLCTAAQEQDVTSLAAGAVPGSQATGDEGTASTSAGPARTLQQGRDQQRDLNATLQALSQQAPSFAEGGQELKSEGEADLSV